LLPDVTDAPNSIPGVLSVRPSLRWSLTLKHLRSFHCYGFFRGGDLCLF